MHSMTTANLYLFWHMAKPVGRRAGIGLLAEMGGKRALDIFRNGPRYAAVGEEAPSVATTLGTPNTVLHFPAKRLERHH
jgi:hypothetical protein